MKQRFSTFACVMMMSVGTAFPAAAQEPDVRRTDNQIQFSHYPPESLRRGEEGVVGVRVTTDRKGNMTDCQVAKTSGYLALDNASCELLLTYGRTNPYLGPDGRTVVRVQDGQVLWQLPPDKRPATPPPLTANASFTASSQSACERKICKSSVRTGSMVARNKVCMTAREWQLQRDGAQRDAQDMVPRYLPGN